MGGLLKSPMVWSSVEITILSIDMNSLSTVLNRKEPLANKCTKDECVVLRPELESLRQLPVGLPELAPTD